MGINAVLEPHMNTAIHAAMMELKGEMEKLIQKANGKVREVDGYEGWLDKYAVQLQNLPPVHKTLHGRVVQEEWNSRETSKDQRTSKEGGSLEDSPDVDVKLSGRGMLPLSQRLSAIVEELNLCDLEESADEDLFTIDELTSKKKGEPKQSKVHGALSNLCDLEESADEDLFTIDELTPKKKGEPKQWMDIDMTSSLMRN